MRHLNPRQRPDVRSLRGASGCGRWEGTPGGRSRDEESLAATHQRTFTLRTPGYRGCEARLRRLGLYYIDVYQDHVWCDGSTEALTGALQWLKEQGEVRSWGCRPTTTTTSGTSIVPPV